jgi:hypothetical protein
MSGRGLAASRVCAGLEALVKATATLRTRRPALPALYDLIERVDAVAQSLEELTLDEEVEAAPSAPRTAASIATHIANSSRALVGVTSGWRLYLPDLHAQRAARRLSTELCRSLVQLAAIERQGIPR